jgi:hypothetical protein
MLNGAEKRTSFSVFFEYRDEVIDDDAFPLMSLKYFEHVNPCIIEGGILKQFSK